MKGMAITAAVATGAVAAIVCMYQWGRHREILILQRWAEQNHLELLHFRQRAFSESAPFPFWTSHRTPNYFVRVRGRDGKERSAWLRLGTVFESTYWGGKDKVQVKWEEEP
ncbi:MAG TPA: hypothetical protein VEC99_17515 [Clostridia bacterium]|nr:hypothetical protein [Clostridia bacterium]